LLSVFGGVEVPLQDDEHELVLWSDNPTMIEFAGNHQVYQFDFVYFTPVNQTCGLPPYPDDLSGFLDANLRTTITLPKGTYHLCLKQGPDASTLHAHIRVLVLDQHSPPPMAPPQPPTLPPPDIQIHVVCVDASVSCNIAAHVDSTYSIVVWSNVATTVQFSGEHQMFPYQFVYFTPFDDACGMPPYPDDLHGFLDANLRTTIKLWAGTYQLCLRQGPTPPVKYSYIRAVAMHEPPSSPPSLPPSLPPTPNPPSLPSPTSPPSLTRYETPLTYIVSWIYAAAVVAVVGLGLLVLLNVYTSDLAFRSKNGSAKNGEHTNRLPMLKLNK
jgi:hypothetical protein